jgi:deoxyadenosine/deoxycytidine kinase
MVTNLKEKLSKEPVVIGVMGPIGVGKSTISKILGKRLGIPVIEEDFPLNPFLERFYENPRRWSYLSQTWFFIKKIEQLNGHNFSQSQLIDPAVEMDFTYAQTLYQLGLMGSHEFRLYKNMFSEIYDLKKEKGIKKPDIFLVVNAPYSVLEKRIRKRGRPFEMIMLEKYPSYLKKLGRNVEKFSGGKSIYIDARDDGYVNVAQINNLIKKIDSVL